MVHLTEDSEKKYCAESSLFFDNSLLPSTLQANQQSSSSKFLVEDPLSCGLDSRQDTSAMTQLNSGVMLLSLQKVLLGLGITLLALKASLLHVLKIIFTAFLLLSLTAVANEQTPLYQQLIISAQQNEVMTEAESKALIAVSKRLAEINKVDPLAPLDVAPFHFRKDKDISAEVENNSGLCVNCHEQQAHSKSVKLRSFLNMHTKTIACQTCHFASDKYSLTYQWQTTAGQLVKQINFTDKKDHLLVPTYQSKSIVPSKDSSFAKELVSQWQKAEKMVDKKQQAMLWQNIHQPLSVDALSKQDKSKQPISCTSCHQQTAPRINLAELGADKQRQQRFEKNIIARFFKRYRKEDDKINLLELLK